MTNNVINYYEPNTSGDDYVVGDIHGCYTLLERRLEEAGFDRSVDRLFSVGDLCDRGPESPRVLEFINEPWFIPVCGNHDEMFIMAYEHATNRKLQDAAFMKFWFHVGGQWWSSLNSDQRNDIYTAFKKLPYFNHITLPNGETVGIVHAQIPPNFSWDETVTLVKSNNEDMLDLIQWGRERILYDHHDIVDGIDRVYCGHTIVQSLPEYRNRYKTPNQSLATENIIPIQKGNVYFIDSGGYMARDNGVDPIRGADNHNPPFDLTILKIS